MTAESIRYPAYVEHGVAPGALAYVFRYPGLHVEGITVEAALAALPAALREEHAWLAAHGVADPASGAAIVVEETERIDLGTDVRRGIWRGLFRYELRPTTDADVAVALERTRFARAEVRAHLESVTDPLDPALEARLQAHADAERELLSKLGSRLPVTRASDIRGYLDAVREASEARLRNLLPGDRERLAVFEGEKWTARKVLRCFAVAERRLLAALKR
jgi:hypothetical protein